MIYDTVAVLCRAGHDAAVLHGSPNAGYPDHPDQPPRLYSRSYQRVRQMRGLNGRRDQLMMPLSFLTDRLRGGPLPPLDLRPDDLIVVPELMIVAAMMAFPKNRIGVFVQNPFSFQRAHADGLARGHDIRRRADWFLGVSEICLDQFELLDIRTGHYLPVSMKPEEFPFRDEKEPVISYMPRRRTEEARQIVAALERRGRIDGYRFDAIDLRPRREVSERLQRSRFFISLLREESIGFPSAEAMAAGCVVIGYTGLGGREYFTPETGIPVTEDDTLGIVRAVEDAVAEYAATPARLDAMRRHASATVNARYNRETFENSLLRIWRDLDAS